MNLPILQYILIIFCFIVKVLCSETLLSDMIHASLSTPRILPNHVNRTYLVMVKA